MIVFAPAPDVPVCATSLPALPGCNFKSESRASSGSTRPRSAPPASEKRKTGRFEHGRQQKSRDETTHMRPPRNTGIMGIAECSAEELHHEPETDHPESAQRKGVKNDPKRHNHRDARPRATQAVTRKNAGNGSRRADHRHPRSRIDQ